MFLLVRLQVALQIIQALAGVRALGHCTAEHDGVFLDDIHDLKATSIKNITC